MTKNHINNETVEIVIDNKNFAGTFTPEFIKEEITLYERNSIKEACESLGKDPMDFVKELKSREGDLRIPFVEKMATFDDYIDYLNGDFPTKGFLTADDENENTDCQPVKHLDTTKKEFNLSNCVLQMKLVNRGASDIEDYKVHFTFENIVEGDAVDIVSDFSETFPIYNVRFISNNKAEFYPGMNFLAPNESASINAICFRVKHDTKNVKLHWELISANTHAKGSFDFEIEPIIEIKPCVRFASDIEPGAKEYRIIPKIVLE